MEPLKVIARYRDGNMVKGTTNNFRPGGTMFHMTPVDAKPGDPPVRVALEELKALFVVHSFEGRLQLQRVAIGDLGKPDQQGACQEPDGHRRCPGERLRVTFKDGEVLEGVSMTYDPDAQGFFMFPDDAGSNNKRMFVINAAVARVRQV